MGKLGGEHIYDHIGTDALPEEFIDYVGKRRHRIAVAALTPWKSYWIAKRGLGA